MKINDEIKEDITKSQTKNIQNLKNKCENKKITKEQVINNEKFLEIYNNDGTINRIKINKDIFKNTKNKSINKTIEEYLKQYIGAVYTIINRKWPKCISRRRFSKRICLFKIIKVIITS